MTMLAPQNLVIFLSAMALCGIAMFQWSRRRTMLLRLRAALGGSGAVLPGEGPGHVLEWLGSHIPGASDDALRAAMVKAGYFQPAALPVFVALRLICTGAVFFCVLLNSRADRSAAFLLASFLAFFASRLFVILLKLRAETRQREISRELPPLIDVLLMVLNSGVSIDQCLRYATGLLEHTAPLASHVFRRYVADVDSGVPFETAFERLGQRLGVDEGYDLANMIKQALLQGGEIMASLEQLGAELADKRVATAREQIGRKAVLLTVVMLVFFMPVLLITLGGPAVSNVTDTLKAVKQELHHRGARQ